MGLQMHQLLATLYVTSSLALLALGGFDLTSVIPHSEIAGMKPPYVCPGCFIHTYSNNMINKFHVQ
jgi:hypothetical protein